MQKLEEIIRFLFLLNAETNSLLEPKMLTIQAIDKVDEFQKKLKTLTLTDEEKSFIINELKTSLGYIEELIKKLEQLQRGISDTLDIAR